MSFPKTLKGLHESIASRKEEWKERYPKRKKELSPFQHPHPTKNKRELAKFAKVAPLEPGYYTKHQKALSKAMLYKKFKEFGGQNPQRSKVNIKNIKHIQVLGRGINEEHLYQGKKNPDRLYRYPFALKDKTKPLTEHIHRIYQKALNKKK